MKANENYISLETAKLLKDCGLYHYSGTYTNISEIGDYDYYSIIEKDISLRTEYDHGTYMDCLYRNGNRGGMGLDRGAEVYPAFTWWEILWKYPKQFFGGELISKGSLGDSNCRVYTGDILYLLQKNQFNEADMYFRIYCILINNKGEQHASFSNL